jgi:hypothetical protein
MLKAFGAALLLVSALAMTADSARALQVVVTQVDKNTDGSDRPAWMQISEIDRVDA